MPLIKGLACLSPYFDWRRIQRLMTLLSKLGIDDVAVLVLIGEGFKAYKTSCYTTPKE